MARKLAIAFAVLALAAGGALWWAWNSLDVLVKGADYAIADIVGREVVESRGGTVTTIALREGLSSSAIIDRIKTGRGV